MGITPQAQRDVVKYSQPCLIRLIEGNGATCLFVAVKAEDDWAAYVKNFAHGFASHLQQDMINETAAYGDKIDEDIAMAMFTIATQCWGSYRA